MIPGAWRPSRRHFSRDPWQRFFVLRTAATFMLLTASAHAAAPHHPVPSSSSPTYVTPEIVKGWLEHNQSVTFLDVREADEFAAGHLPGAISIVYDQVQALIDQLPHDHPIVVYCIHSTHRAPTAAATLWQLGFKNAYVLEGGIVAWQTGGLTIQASDLARQPTILPLTERCRNKTNKGS